MVLTTTLNIRNFGTGYASDDFEDEFNRDPDHIYEWLADSHPKRGDIQITLTSPQGTTCTLLPYRLFDFVNEEGFDNWPFMSVHYWGENPVGTWELRVSFRSSSGYVTMTNLQIQLHGTRTTPLSVSRIPAQCDPACRGRCSGTGPQNCDVCRQKRVASTQECVSSCPAGTRSFKNYCLTTPQRTTSPAMNPTTQPPPATNPATNPSPATNPATHTPVDLASTSTQESYTTSPSKRPPFNESTIDVSIFEDDDGNHNLPIIIGSSVGGVVLLAIIIVVCVAVLAAITCRSRSRSQEIEFTRLGPERDVPAIV